MRVQISDHQHKSTALKAALEAAGVDVVRDRADILLIDWDGNVGHYPKTIEQAYSEGAEIVLYSHGAPAILVWDSVWPVGEYTTAYLAQSPGQKWVMEAYGYPLPIHVIGWHYCDIKPFQPIERIRNILFAPWHPHGNGWMNVGPKMLNKRIFDILSRLPYRLTVRHVYEPELSGVEKREGIHYQKADLTIDSSIVAIDEADLIVSNPGTFATLAVARGKPVIMYGQNIKPHDGYSYEGLNYVKNWDAYRDYMQYPYDIGEMNEQGVQTIIDYAKDIEAREWREKFVGNPLDVTTLVGALEGVLENARATA